MIIAFRVVEKESRQGKATRPVKVLVLLAYAGYAVFRAAPPYDAAAECFRVSLHPVNGTYCVWVYAAERQNERKKKTAAARPFVVARASKYFRT